MRDTVLQIAGVLAVLAGLVHGALGETKVFPRAQIEPPWVRRLVRAVWHCGVVAWLAVGALLIATPSVTTEDARRWIIGVGVAVYGSAALANALATRGRHFGWMVLSAVVVLTLMGI
jgi:hypothetical protein